MLGTDGISGDPRSSASAVSAVRRLLFLRHRDKIDGEDDVEAFAVATVVEESGASMPVAQPVEEHGPSWTDAAVSPAPEPDADDIVRDSMASQIPEEGMSLSEVERPEPPLPEVSGGAAPEPDVRAVVVPDRPLGVPEAVTEGPTLVGEVVPPPSALSVGGGGGMPPTIDVVRQDDGGGDGRGFWNVVDKPMTIWEHLDELRRRLMVMVVAFIVATGGLFLFSRRLIRAMARWYGVHLINIRPLESIFGAMRLAALGGLILSFPILLYEIVAYVLPALTRRERRLLFSLLPATVLLFAGGCTFGLLVVEPIIFHVAERFLAIPTTPALSYWIDFLVNYSLPFGAFFELPIVVLILAKLGLITARTLARGRRIAYFAAFVLGMAVAPPGDVIVTPTLVAGPVILLYEVSIWLARSAERHLWRDEF